MPKYSEEELLALARQAYRQGAASFSVTAEECALLVIDMQNEFVKPYWAPYWIPEATRQIPKMRRLIEWCRLNRIPVIYTVFSNTHRFMDRPYTGSYMPNRFPDIEDHNPAWFQEVKVHDGLTPLAEEIVIPKPSYGAFYDTPLDTILRNMNKRAVIICGTLTNFCCGTTARQAYERGYKVIFGSDVCATDDMDLQEAELMVLRKGFAKVLTSEDIMDRLAEGI
ncbi:MAG TPA: isochorismatase family cysteine hydrolase [Selenomonadales bacterium]|nr:isochorismatase family cysteine hydrolase [Selenomonadales bacterium]